ncbi:MAG: hypothetical protein H7831_10020 [Magnetococcus sp. WYHC-3]
MSSCPKSGVHHSRFAERIMTVAATCRQQNRNVPEFLVAALEANHCGTAPPALLPGLAVRMDQAA